MRDKVESLLRARQDADAHKTQLDAAQAEFEADHAALIASYTMAKHRVVELEGEVRGAALEIYRETKALYPAPGVAIRIFKVMEYDPKEALAWAKDHVLALTPASLDKKAFEKIADATPMPDLVTIKDDPRAQISPDLAKALEG